MSSDQFPQSDWKTGPLENDVDTEMVQQEIANTIGEHDATGNTQAIVVVHRGKLVAEAYGADIDATTPLISWSMAKSITHALVGLALGDGLLDPTAAAPLVQWGNDARGVITLQHLLEMRSGLAWVEDYVVADSSDVIDMLFGSGKDDHAAYAIARPRAHEPGSTWLYSSGTTNIITRVLGDLLGDSPGSSQHINSFLQHRLFDAIGMQATAGFDAAGTFVGSSYVFATARNFARFGYLYLRDGEWNGKRVLPTGWVDHARTQTVFDQESGFGYGAHWWILPDEKHSLVAMGYEGQRIFVLPSRDLVVVRLGKTNAEKADAMRASLMNIIRAFPEGLQP